MIHSKPFVHCTEKIKFNIWLPIFLEYFSVVRYFCQTELVKCTTDLIVALLKKTKYNIKCTQLLKNLIYNSVHFPPQIHGTIPFLFRGTITTGV